MFYFPLQRWHRNSFSAINNERCVHRLGCSLSCYASYPNREATAQYNSGWIAQSVQRAQKMLYILPQCQTWGTVHADRQTWRKLCTFSPWMLPKYNHISNIAGSKKWQILENGNYRTRDTRETQRSSIEEQKTLREEDGPVTRILKSREVEV